MPPVVQTAKTDWPGPYRAKRQKLQACFAWNDAKLCVATPCRFALDVAESIELGCAIRPSRHRRLPQVKCMGNFVF